MDVKRMSTSRVVGWEREVGVRGLIQHLPKFNTAPALPKESHLARKGDLLFANCLVGDIWAVFEASKPRPNDPIAGILSVQSDPSPSKLLRQVTCLEDRHLLLQVVVF